MEACARVPKSLRQTSCASFSAWRSPGQNRFAEGSPYLERACTTPARAGVLENPAPINARRASSPAPKKPARGARAQSAVGRCSPRSRACCAGHRAEEAQELLERALAIEPAHAAANYHLGEILAARDQLDRAEQHLRSSLAADRNVAAVHNALGSVLGQKGELAAAVASFARAAELDRNAPVGHANLAIALDVVGFRANETAAP